MRDRSPVQTAAFIAGLVFLLVGMADFIPGITTDDDDLSFVGHDACELLGIFEVNVLHDIVHLLFAVGIAPVATAAKGRASLIGRRHRMPRRAGRPPGVDRGSDGNVIAIDDADNRLHLGLAAAMILLGLVPPRERADGGAQRAQPEAASSAGAGWASGRPMRRSQRACEASADHSVGCAW